MAGTVLTVDLIEEYERMLRKHDWHYDYSDDHSVWQRGRDSESKLILLAREHPILNVVLQGWQKTVFNRQHFHDVEVHRKYLISYAIGHLVTANT